MSVGPNEPPRYKVIVLGNVGVGKTSISNRQCRMPFRADVRPSVGVLKMKTFAQVGGNTVHLEIWDTAGQEQYLSLVPMYVRGASVCILVASIIDEASIPAMDRWLEQVKATDPGVPAVVAVNKVDLVDDPSVVERIRHSLIQKYPNLYFCSAKRGDGIQALFAGAAEQCLNARRPTIQATAAAIPADPPPPSGGCC
jgi:small GTP-binding protein